MTWALWLLSVVRSSRVARYFLAAAGAIATVATVCCMAFVRGAALGRARANHEAVIRDIERRNIRDEVDRAINREPDVVRRLRDRWSRD
jgi:hypothetical protein